MEDNYHLESLSDSIMHFQYALLGNWDGSIEYYRGRRERINDVDVLQ